jgi:hypothetical protein
MGLRWVCSSQAIRTVGDWLALTKVVRVPATAAAFGLGGEGHAALSCVVGGIFGTGNIRPLGVFHFHHMPTASLSTPTG